MEWYIPITILPGIGMLILSTTGQMMTLSMEIGELLSKKCSPIQHSISDMKIKQLERLTKSATLLYISAACFVLSGILDAVMPIALSFNLPNYTLITGVIMVFVALALLINYSFHTVKIRKLQHNHNHTME
ncbi:MAG: hypothetical protein ACRBF0_13555 [Calditrichia bacterium]